MRRYIMPLLFMVTLCSTGIYLYARSYWFPVYLKMTGERSLSDVQKDYEQDPQRRLQQRFEQAAVPFVNTAITLIGLKEEKQLELWAQHEQRWRFIHSYPMTAASGHAGPKLREGDWQVPEGLYKIIWLNPNSSYHLSMKIDYPNQFDLKHARADGRTEPGSDIFIHGKAVSIGCIALGDEAIDELFGLVHSVGTERVSVIIAPHDGRVRALQAGKELPSWCGELYQQIQTALQLYQK